MNVEGSVVLLTLDTEMTPDVLHEVVAVGVTDLFGNAVLGPYDRATFTGFRPARPERRRFDLWRMLPNGTGERAGALSHAALIELARHSLRAAAIAPPPQRTA